MVEGFRCATYLLTNERSTTQKEEEMSVKPITHIGLHLGAQVGEDDIIVGVRVVPTKREGRTVFARTLNFEEQDNGEAITGEPGDPLLFPAGSMKITIADVDRYSEPTSDGYAPVANTVWSWNAIPPLKHPQARHNYLLAAARRLDTAHGHSVEALKGLTSSSSQSSFLKARAVMFEALGHAELMCIALSRAMRMIQKAKAKVGVTVAVPKEVQALESRVTAIRHAFEHIDDRATGKAHHEGPSDAMTVLDQTDFFKSGVLRYASNSLDVAAEAIPAMLAARKFIIDAVAAEGPTKTYNSDLKFTLTDDSEPSSAVSPNEAK